MLIDVKQHSASANRSKLMLDKYNQVDRTIMKIMNYLTFCLSWECVIFSTSWSTPVQMNINMRNDMAHLATVFSLRFFMVGCRNTNFPMAQWRARPQNENISLNRKKWISYIVHLHHITDTIALLLYICSVERTNNIFHVFLSHLISF